MVLVLVEEAAGGGGGVGGWWKLLVVVVEAGGDGGVGAGVTRYVARYERMHCITCTAVRTKRRTTCYHMFGMLKLACRCGV